MRKIKTKILIADDEADIVSMLRSFFESKGYLVLSATNGTEALKQVERQPDIILLDINMPGSTGLEICERIRDHISCPILFLTARIEDTDKVKGFAAGGDDYIVKPFSLMELEARVSAHLRRETRNLTSWNCYPKIQDRFLTKKGYMNASGVMTATATAMLWPNIFAEYVRKLLYTQTECILKQFGGVGING